MSQAEFSCLSFCPSQDLYDVSSDISSENILLNVSCYLSFNKMNKTDSPRVYSRALGDYLTVSGILFFPSFLRLVKGMTVISKNKQNGKIGPKRTRIHQR